MSRPKKDAKYLNVYLDRKIYEDFEKFCIEMGQSKTLAAERALQMYMREMRKKITSNESSCDSEKH